MLTVKEINEAYLRQAKAQGQVAECGLRAANAKADYERKLKAGLADGTIAGKNADLREAAAAEILAAELAELDVAQAGERMAKLALDLAQTEVSRVQAVLRLKESMRRGRR